MVVRIEGHGPIQRLWAFRVKVQDFAPTAVRRLSRERCSLTAVVGAADIVGGVLYVASFSGDFWR